MRNLLISLTFIFTLLFGLSTNVFSQINGHTLGAQTNQDLSISQFSVTIGSGSDALTFNRGSGIVIPITGIGDLPRADIPVVHVDISKERNNTIYTHTSSYTQTWSLTIPDSEITNWESGTYTLTVTIGSITAISEEFTID